MAEEDILFHEMDWVRSACYRIDRDKRRDARLNLTSLLVAVSAGFGGDIETYDNLMRALEDEQERSARMESEQQDMEQRLAADRAERAALIAAGGQGWGSQ